MRYEQEPASAFRRFEKVQVTDAGAAAEFSGQAGAVLWCERPCRNKRTGTWGEWEYAVYFPALDRYRSFPGSALRATGEFAAEESLLGRRFELSYDAVPGQDMIVAEGCFRLPGGHWQVFVFSNEDVPEIRHGVVNWPSAVTGVEFQVPMKTPIDPDLIAGAMAEVFGAESWAVVEGPDSLVLR